MLPLGVAEADANGVDAMLKYEARRLWNDCRGLDRDEDDDEISWRWLLTLEATLPSLALRIWS